MSRSRGDRPSESGRGGSGAVSQRSAVVLAAVVTIIVLVGIALMRDALVPPL